jgi:hypothetical protein
LDDLPRELFAHLRYTDAFSGSVTNYYFEASDYGYGGILFLGSTGGYTYQVVAPDSQPTITTQPLSVLVSVGQNATFTVAASGTPALSYQWVKDGVNLADGGRISGATTATLQITGVSTADAGNYAVVITNSIGSVTSNAAVLTVNPVPTIDLDHWTNRSSGTTNFLSGVSWSGSQFVAVGDAGTILASGDGISWTSRSYGAYNVFYGVTCGGSQFAVVGGGYTFLTSGDGINWTSRNFSTYNELYSVSWSGSQFVAVGYGGTILTSSDGITWTGRSPGPYNMLHSVTWSGSQFVAVGAAGTILTSGDGISWTNRNSGTTRFLSGVIWSGSQFVAVGDAGTILSSGDGISWTSRNSGTNNMFYGVAWGGGQFAVVGFNGVILSSGDGISWTRRNSGSTNRLIGVTWSGSQFVTVGAGGTILTSGAQSAAQLTLGNLSATYDGTPKAATATTNPGGLTVSFTYNGSSTAPTNAGSYTVVATINDPNYQGTATGTLVIAQAPLTATAVNKTRPYNTANPAFMIAYTGFVNNETAAVLTAAPSASTTATDISTPGTYPITLTGGSAANYTLTLVNGTLTVTNKTVPTITWASPAAITYGTALSANQLSATADVPGAFIYSPAAGVVLGAGGQPLSVTFTPTDSTNYATATATLTLTVNKATLTATAANQSRIYGAANPALTFSYSSFVNNETAAAITAPTAGTTATTSSAVGIYPITLTGGSAANYTLTLVNGTLSITKAALAAKADNQTRVYSAADPTFTISYTGFANGDTAAAITAPTASTAATSTSLPGTYPITLTGGTAANYTLTLTNGTLTVTPRDYSGTYFGTFTSGSSWALYIRADSTATYIAYLPSRNSVIFVSLTVGVDGSFTVTGTEIVPLSGAVNGLATSALPFEGSPRRTAAAASSFTLTGQIGVNGAISGSLAGLGATFSGAVDPATGPAASLAGLYRAAALGTAGGAAYTVVGASGQAVVISTTPTSVGGATGTVNGSGVLTVTTSNNAQLAVSINASAQTVSASLTPSGSTTPITYYGLSDTVTPNGYLANLSVRAAMAAGQTLIVGFVVDGGAKPMLVRAAGPVLNRYGLTGVVDPNLTLYNGGTVVASNDNWDASLVTTFATLGAFAFDAASKDAALLQSINGPHTAQATATGAGAILVEAYDAGPNDGRKLVNLSTRFQVGTGDNILIAGFVLSGTGTKQLLIRAVGPTLTNYGVTGVLADPQLSVFDVGTPIASNNDWSSSLSATFTTLGAFALNAGSKDAALVVTLQAGKAYTVQVSGVGNTTGEALVEIYLMP